jgi:hypothetical protein
MKHRYLIYLLNHTPLVVDLTSVGLPDEIYPPEGREQDLPSRRFRSWQTARQFLLSNGADPESLGKVEGALRAASLAVLTIPLFDGKARKHTT